MKDTVSLLQEIIHNPHASATAIYNRAGSSPGPGLSYPNDVACVLSGIETLQHMDPEFLAEVLRLEKANMAVS